jgi:hypothetical protein
MQGYQRRNDPSRVYCLGALDPCPIEMLAHGGKREGGQVQDLSQAPFLREPVVPVSPGHVRFPYPYLPSRRRRR